MLRFECDGNERRHIQYRLVHSRVEQRAFHDYNYDRLSELW